MSYGSFNRMQFASTKSNFVTTNLGGSSSTETSGWESLTSYPSPQIVRSGNNTPDFFKRKDVLITSVSFVKKRKLIGYRYHYRTKKYYVKGQDSGEPIQLLKREKVRHPVYLRTYVPVVKEFKRIIPLNLLLAPNQLSMTYTSKSVDRNSNTFVATTWDGDDPFRTLSISTFGYPSDLVFRNPSGIPSSEFYTSAQRNPSWTSVADSVDPSVLIELERRALSKLYKKVANEFPDYLTEYAQLNQSIGTLKSILSKGIKLARALKHLDLKTLKRGTSAIMPKALSQQWLEYIYGVAPVLQTINDSIELYGREARTWRTYSSSASTIVSVDKIGGFPASDFYPNKLSSRHEKMYREITVRYGVIMSATSSFERYVKRSNTLSALATTAYEFIPWSFVLDWVYDIGGWLSSHNAIDEYMLHAWKTTTISSSSVATHSPIARHPAYANSYSFSPFTVTDVHNSVVREILPSLPDMPPPSLKGYNDAASITRGFNSLALLLQKSS